MNAEVAVEPTVTTHSILRRYMADYTNTTSFTSKVTYGFYAFHLVESGLVWLAETESFKTTIKRFKQKINLPGAFQEAVNRGETLELWLLTQPDRFSASELERELWENDRLTYRKEVKLDGPGRLYCIRHNYCGSYFLVTDRAGVAKSTLLCNYLERLRKLKGDGNNKALNEFVNKQANDILMGTNFVVTEIGSFLSKADAQKKRKDFIANNIHGQNLNWRQVN